MKSHSFSQSMLESDIPAPTMSALLHYIDYLRRRIAHLEESATSTASVSLTQSKITETSQHSASHDDSAEDHITHENVLNTSAISASLMQLQSFEARLISLIETLPAYVWFKDTTGKVLFANRRFHELLPLDPSIDPAGKMTEQLWPKERSERYLKQDAEVLATCKTVRLEEHLIANDQSRWMEIVKAPILDQNGTLIGTVGYAHDITQLKQNEKALMLSHEELEYRIQQRGSELQAMNDELESFAYSVSHDLRAPLRAIDGFTRILQEEHGTQLDAPALQYLNRVIESTHQMNLLIDNLLSLSRTSRIDMLKVDCDLAPLIQEIQQTLHTEEPGRSVLFHITAPLPAYGDPHLLKIVLDNLVRNAWKFTRPCPQPEIIVGRDLASIEQPYFVHDNGVGFDMIYANKLFAPFQRLHGVREFEGTGIGLAIVRRIIQRHGGRVWAESVVNQGTTLFFTLPLSPSRVTAVS